MIGCPRSKKRSNFLEDVGESFGDWVNLKAEKALSISMELELVA